MGSLAVITYIIYALFVTTLTIVVAKILFKNSLVFMLKIFENKNDLAIATNRLFEVGFFLFGFGIGLWYLTENSKIGDLQVLFEVLSVKIGGFTIFIGTLLFGNLFMFFRGLKSSKKAQLAVIDNNQK